ncbi:MAG TPA: TonB-dependent receptor [Steroidobacteraceae bacterium]|nr:TonB-dependent receptor [Steroidobacteraceae bacterium]
MTRSRFKPPRRDADTAAREFQRLMLRQLPLASAISAILAGISPVARAQTAPPPPPSDTLQEVTVTAQKVKENLQDVPVSIEAIGTQKLEQLNIVNLDTYVEYLAGVTTIKSIGQGGNGVGTTHVYMRGINSGQDGNHSGSQPTVGTYFDEQPVTTIDGTVDVHVYDIARIEVLEGPQGTLYGASSEAGTIRIISNKPDPTKFEASYDVAGDQITNGGGTGWKAEGFVNIPLSPIAAVRIVGWDEHDPGYINNVAGTNANAGIVNGNRSFPVWTGLTGQTLSNAAYVSKNYNTSETRGGRVALKLDLGDNWTVTPTFMGQSLAANGFFAYDPAVGPLDLVHSGPENDQDSFTQTALTVEGKVSDFDITYAGAWFTRNQHSIADYSDYSYWYDKYYGSGTFWTNNAGTPIMPQEFVIEDNHYNKWSNELRVSTPQQKPVKATVGLFAERQVHEIWEDYVMPGAGGNPYTYNSQGFGSDFTIPGLNNNSIWLTDEERVDRDYAGFAQVTWDITGGWSLTGGFRQYRYDNSLQGFYGYALGYTGPGEHSGQATCGPPGQGGSLTTQYPNYAPFHFAPCTDLNLTSVSANGHTELLRLSYKFDPDHMMYATYSTGFRPGGVNRVFDKAINAIYPPYGSDELKNYEIGWKTQWFDEHLRWNGALFWEDWNNFQFSYLGPNSVTVVQNAASARSRGIESNLEWVVGNGWTVSGSATFLDAKLTSNFCGSNTLTLPTSCPTQQSGASGSPISYADGTVVQGPYAPAGTRLPGTPRLKANVVGRYNFPLFSDWNAYSQAALVYQDASVPLLFPSFYQNGPAGQQHLGELPPYTLVNLAAGVEHNGLHMEVRLDNTFNVLGELTRFAACTPTSCNQPYVSPVQPRTVWLQFGQKF